jgi:DNA-binding response OmpR family regulator
MFKTLGAEVDVAVDGMAGYELAKRNHYELIVTDILMPNLAGDRMVSRLRDEGWDGKVIAISAFHDGVWEHDLLEHGAVTCLYKPFKLDDMIKTLNEIF